MQHIPAQDILEAESYFRRLPERLVLEGYRSWAMGYTSGNTDHWNEVWNLYAKELGPKDGRHALNALMSFMKKTAICAKCQLRMFKAGSAHICRDEALILCLISSIQGGDDAASALCLSNLTCQNRCREVAMEAANFALVLRALKQTLLPIPKQAIENILEHYQQPNFVWPDESQPSKTIH